jgi:hypothetical protein
MPPDDDADAAQQLARTQTAHYDTQQRLRYARIALWLLLPICLSACGIITSYTQFAAPSFGRTFAWTVQTALFIVPIFGLVGAYMR